MASAGGKYSLEIASGLYRGAKLELDEGRHVVGGEDADVVLLEQSIQPTHAAITLRADTIRVEGLSDGVVVESAGPVPPGSARTVLLPAAIRVGDVRMVWRLDGAGTMHGMIAAHPTVAKMREVFDREILPRVARLRERSRAAASQTDPADETLAPSPTEAKRGIDGHAIFVGTEAPARSAGLRDRFRHPALLGVAAAVLLFATVFWSFLNGGATALTGRVADGVGKESTLRLSGKSTARAEDGSGRVTLAAADRIELGAEAKSTASSGGSAKRSELPTSLSLPKGADGAVATAAASLRNDVEQAGLLNVVIGTAGATVTATGTVEPEMAARWQSAQESFDARYSGDVTLVNTVALRAEKLPPSLGIEGVWRGDRPYIMVRGQRYLIGAVLDGGWAIRSIEQDRVMLERNGRLVAMRF